MPPPPDDDLIPWFRSSRTVWRGSQDLKLTLLAPPAFLTNRRAEGQFLCVGGERGRIFGPKKQTNNNKKNKRVSITLYLRNLTSYPIPLLFQLLLIRGRTFRGTRSLPTGRCIVIGHIRLLIEQQFSISWSGCPSPSPASPLLLLHTALRKQTDKHELLTLPIIDVLFFFICNFLNLNFFEKEGPHCSL